MFEILVSTVRNRGLCMNDNQKRPDSEMSWISLLKFAEKPAPSRILEIFPVLIGSGVRST